MSASKKHGKASAQTSSISSKKGAWEPAGFKQNAKTSVDAMTKSRQPSRLTGETILQMMSSSSGSKLPYRQEMEQAFNQDFSSVQTHIGKAAEMKSIGAQAAAIDDTVIFADASPSKELVAHELTHVAQNRAFGSTGGVASSGISSPNDAAEREASRLAPLAAMGQRVSVSARPSARIHRYIENDEGHKESNAGHMRLEHKKGLFATQGAVDSANIKLKSTDAYVKLGVDFSDMRTNWRKQPLGKVSPVWVPKENKKDHHSKLNEVNKDASLDTYHSQSDCHFNAQTVMGSSQKGKHNNTERGVIKDGVGTEKIAPQRSVSSPGAKADSANRTVYAMMSVMMAKFQKHLEAHKEIDVPKPIENLLTTLLNEEVTFKEVRQWHTYKAIVEDKELGPMFAKMFGINEFASPQVGEGLSIISGMTAGKLFYSEKMFTDLLDRGISLEQLTKLGVQRDTPYNQMIERLLKAGDEVKAILAKTNLLKQMKANTEVLKNLSMKEDPIKLVETGGIEAFMQKISRKELFDLIKAKVVNVGLGEIQLNDLELKNVPTNYAEAMPGAMNFASSGTLAESWNFHWAGVILRDLVDHVTLENFSVGNQGRVNASWMYAMYGELNPDQSFHRKYKDSGDFGNVALTARFQDEKEDT